MRQDYTILDTIYASDKYRVYVADAVHEGRKVLLKAISDSEVNPATALALQNEYSITQELNNSLKPHALTYMGSSVAFVRDFLEGITLAKWLEDNPLSRDTSLEKRLHLAIALTKEIELLHNQRLIHKDINPTNIIVSHDETSVFIIDYEIASKLDIKTHFLGNPERLEGTLAYISPEQTGRMNRVVDYRCDLYALGVVLYELFAGKKPFFFTGANSALEYIHAHIARNPLHPAKIVGQGSEHDSMVPIVIGDIIMKLLAKNAEDRYQSAFRVRKDLEECLLQWKTHRAIAPFPVGKSDIALKFQIPQRLYGREKEHLLLMEAFYKAASGRKMMMLVSGYSGIGKTALVYDVHVPVTERNAMFISGKFEQFRRNIPFYAWSNAFTEFAELLLTENTESIQRWKKRILDAMGDLAGVITQLVPALEKIIGKQPTPPLIPTNETQNRFNYALRTFIKVISTKERPLVVFIDDLQWADSASLNLLRVIMTEPGFGHLFVIGAYRDNEVNESHPFLRAIEDIRKEWLALNALDASDAHAPDNILIEQITLRNLQQDHINHLLADTLRQTLAQTSALATLVYTKTDGNAFFVHRFVESLYEKGFIELVTHENEPEWRFDIKAIEGLTATENVIDLLAQKIVRLPELTQKLLRNAAVTGHLFSVKMVSVLTDNSPTDSEAGLWSALEEGLITPEDPSYRFIKGFGEKDSALTRFRFVHDRIRQTVYESIAQNDKKRIHKKAALHLLETLDEYETEQQIFEIANHLNSASDVVEDTALLCRINFQAGSRAKLSTAYSTAFNYFEQAISSLEEGSWRKNYSFTLSLYDQTSETAFLSGQYEVMEKFIKEILKHSTTTLDKVKALEIRTNALFTEQKLVESVQSGLEALGLLGMKLPANPSQMTVVLELLKTKQALKKLSPEALLRLPAMTDRTELAKMRIMATLAPALFFTNPNLFPIMLFRMTVTSAQHGIASSSAYAFGSFGFVLCGVTGEVAKGIEFGELALNLIHERNFNEYQARALFVVRYFIDHWYKPMVKNVVQIKDAYRHSLESGEADFTAFLGNGYVVYLILSGESLENVEQELMKQLQYITQNKQFTSLTFNNLYHQFVLCLLGKAENPALIQGERYDVVAQEPELIRTNNQSTLFNQSYFQMQLSLLMGNIEEGLRYAERAMASRQTVVGTSISLQALFIDALLRFHAVQQGLNSKRRKEIARIKKQCKQLRKVVQTSPGDFTHKVRCLEACIFALEGKIEKALTAISQALDIVQTSGNLYDKCFIALETYRLHRYFANKESTLETLRIAMTLLREWNATAVLERIQEEPLYKGISSRQESDSRNDNDGFPSQEKQFRSGSGGATNSMSNQTIDIDSIVKGTQIITGELNKKNLFEKMLAVMSENAGAERGVIIFEQSEGKFAVQAELSEDSSLKTLDEPIHYENYPNACLAIINYVLHSGVNLVLDNALADTRFMNDRYVKMNQIKSVLCSKILVKSKIVGILYLENNLVSGAFTANRIEVLNILGAQAAIAIENARYYAFVEDMNKNLEQKVQERTRELAEKNNLLLELNREKSELMGIVAHDLKNPIGAIRGLAELVQQEIVKDKQVIEMSGQIVNTADRMLDLVKNMLELNKIEEGSFVLHFQKFDISTLVESTIWQYEHLASVKNIAMKFLTDDTINEVLADEQALMQVLDNLVSNAVKYSPFDKTVTVGIESKQEAVRVYIQDEGPGISGEDMKKLFGKFARLSARPTGGEHSTGLGLSIVKKMVEAMNGRVWCESELGKGATFIVELPKAQSKPAT